MKTMNNILEYKKVDNGILVSFKYISKLSVINANQVEEELQHVIRHGETSLFLDFSTIEFIDTAGFQALLSIHIDSKLNHVKFVLVNVTEDILELFKLVKLDHVFEMKPSNDSDFNMLKKAV